MRKLTFVFVTFGSDIFWTAIGSRWSRCKFHDTITPADFSNSRTGQLISILKWRNLPYNTLLKTEIHQRRLLYIDDFEIQCISVLKLWVFWSSQHWYELNETNSRFGFFFHRFFYLIRKFSEPRSSLSQEVEPEITKPHWSDTSNGTTFK
jgi:hypothetical protein